MALGGIFASRAEALAPDGTAVAGRSATEAGRRAVRWTAAAGLAVLACPGGSACDARPLAVADGVQWIAGCASLPEGERAVAWSSDLSAALVAQLLGAAGAPPPPGWTLTCATDLSADGRVIAGTARSSEGRVAAWVARLD